MLKILALWRVKDERKGRRRMPWYPSAMKDVVSCDKLRVGANIPGSADFRMGEPIWLKARYPRGG